MDFHFIDDVINNLAAASEACPLIAPHRLPGRQRPADRAGAALVLWQSALPDRRVAPLNRRPW